MEMTRPMRIVRGALIGLATLFWALLLFLPMPRTTAAENATFLCRWSDGSETEEGYFEACRDLGGIDGTGILLKRGDLTGTIETGSACRAALAALETGDLPDLLRTDVSAATQLERDALRRQYGGRLFYADDLFAWTGEGIGRAAVGASDELVLLSGRISEELFGQISAKTVYLRAQAEFSAALLAGARTERIVAEAPYLSEGETVCVFGTGGVRLIAGMPLSRAVRVPQTAEFAEEGALLPCRSLEEVEVPFLGNSADAFGADYRGEFAYLFSSGTEYRVPATLKKVRVTGGTIGAHAFYACGRIAEIDACGVSPEHIEREAFTDCTGLRLLHTPQPDVLLPGDFTGTVAPCGCTVFVRADG